ncbi:Alkaline phosphatase [Candidatus Rhodobacter oscarellae]|uniref:Alkaline phosphatase n=1 Tax=Candidatus Rhodobacter oscarellae TaxID=1675527 RepID=A0A0J9E7L6_9RHOB|nr:pre-peptidase C-terminal domain-containing protein [Candidatus Rhodobacter lobularis]KMW57774.1 Alkaline phosphatase [Candidatus Rhodobacter lobularis]
MCIICNRFNPFHENCEYEGLPNGGASELGGVSGLTVNEGADAAASISTSYSMGVGDTFVGTLGAAGDQDWVAVNVTAGQSYTFTMNGASLSDPLLRLYDDSGNLITLNDNISFPSNPNAQINYTATHTGTVFVAAGAFDDSLTGTYSITATGGAVTPRPSSGVQPLSSIDWGYSAPSTINVFFAAAGVTVNDGSTWTTTGWSSYEMQQMMLGFENFENVANVTFNYVNSISQADFVMFESTTATTALGYWAVGGGSITYGAASYSLDGWGVFNASGQGWNTAGLAQGGYGYVTGIHEIGHGLGLAHPHDGGGTSSVMTGVSSAFGDYGTYGLNQGIWTTMSYNDGWQTAPHGQTPSTNYGYQGTLMTLDIAELQNTYGANTTYNTGDDIYWLPTSNGAGTFYSSIWDAGGTDTIRTMGGMAHIINLQAADLTNSSTGGGQVSYGTGIHGGFTIANGVVIENAIGWTGDDTIVGNEAANTLDGWSGHDRIFAGNGNDLVIGGDGDDLLNGDNENDTIRGGNGNDTVAGGRGDDSLFGDNNDDILFGWLGLDTINGGEGNDTLIGEEDSDLLDGWSGNDWLYGGQGWDTLIGGGGADNLNGDGEDDVLIGGDGNDTLAGGTGNDFLHGEDDNDLLFGWLGNDTLEGGNGNDTLNGEGDNDTVSGGAGNDLLIGADGDDFLVGWLDNDTLDGGAGNDLMNGEGGSDVFVFFDGHGSDTIQGFEATNDLEDIDLAGVAGLTSFAQMVATNAITQVGGDVVIDTGTGTITLAGVSLGDLDQADFIF